MNEIAAALLGALAAGLAQTLLGVRERRHRLETLLVALASEVHAICELIRFNDYLGTYRRLANAIRSETWHRECVTVDIRQDYFTIFHSNAQNIGSLKPAQAQLIVHFYLRCKSAIDRADPMNIAANPSSDEEQRANIIALESLLADILHVGGLVVQLPKTAIFMPGHALFAARGRPR